MNGPILCVCLILLFCSARSVLCQGISAPMRAQDRRLDKPVSISESHIVVGELLRRFADQTGVALEIDPRDMSSGYDLFAQCSRVPVGQMMDALYSLVSTRGAEWKWLRQGKPDHYSYLLIESQPAKQRPEHYRARARQILRDFMAVMRRLSEMEPKERSRHKDELRSALKFDADVMHEADTVLDNFLQAQDPWSGAKLFFGIISPDQQDQVLDGRAALSFRADQLPAPMLSQYQILWASGEHASLQPDGAYKRDPLPEGFTISLINPSPGESQLAPYVLIQYKDTIGMSLLGTGWSSYSVRATVLHDWILPGDSKEDPAGDRIVRKKRVDDLPEPRLEGLNGHFYHAALPGAMAARLTALVGGTSIPLLAVLPKRETDVPGKPENQKVRDLLELMHRGLEVISKWRGGVLLLNNPDWFLAQEPAVPYRWLRRLEGGKNRSLPLPASRR